MHVSGLYVYPVKSLRGFAVPRVEFDALGIVGDRRFLVVDNDNRFLTQRVLPKMAQVATALRDGFLTLSAENAGTISVPLASQPDAPLRSVTVWRSEGLLAEDCGNEAAAWLSRFLGLPCRLVRAGRDFRRTVTKPAAIPGDQVSFADAVPVLALGEASWLDLNDRLAERGGESVPMDRFRPTLVVAGAAPFAEDAWPRVRVGAVVLRAAGPCARCIITTTDQHTGERGKEPLLTLATYRRDPVDRTLVNFGQNFIHETKTGVVSVGDPVVPG